MTVRPPSPILRCLLLLLCLTCFIGRAQAQRLRLVLEHPKKGRALLELTELDMSRGFDARTLQILDFPSNKVRRTLGLVKEHLRNKLIRTGDFELFRALQEQARRDEVIVLTEAGYRPVTHRRDLRRSAIRDHMEFGWGKKTVRLLLKPGRHNSATLHLEVGKVSRRLVRISPQKLPAAPGLDPEDQQADRIFEAAVLGGGRVLAVVVGTWYEEYSHRVGWQRVLFLPLKPGARQFRLPYPMKPTDRDWPDGLTIPTSGKE